MTFLEGLALALQVAKEALGLAKPKDTPSPPDLTKMQPPPPPPKEKE